MNLFDTHAHLDQEEFAADLDAVLARAAAAAVEHIVSIGVGAASSEATVSLAAAHQPIHAAVGIHPNYCQEAQPGDWDRVRQLARQPKVVAIGETGLDRYRDYAPFELQRDYFDRHLRLSQETGLPFVVHARESLDEILAMLRDAHSRGPLSGIMHSFTGAADVAAECVELGLYISFAGMLTFKKSDDLRGVAATVPTNRLLIETDSPYLAPDPMRGKRNEPAYVAHTARRLADVRGVSLDELADQTTANARRLFRLG
ncbi:MAG: TatD family hydrolase [Pirellulales bacterium]|nr:TatD family hydrolase [Pirellulales bacterium]